MSTLRFDNRVAVITGGGRGLGAAHARLLAARGCKVVVNDPGLTMAGDATDAKEDGCPAEALVAEIKAAGGDAVASLDSVATPEGGAAIIQAALDAYGRIDILIHSAGNVRKKTIAELTYDDFEAILDVHLRGAFHVAKPALAAMTRAGYGRMVFTGSINGLYGKSEATAYSTAKGGLIGLSHSIGIEGAPHSVASNVIIPAAVTRMSAGIDTSMFPPMLPEMVAPVVAYLCHESCALNGELLISAAGRTARAWVAENPGVYQPEWTLEQVAEQIDAIRDTGSPLHFAPVPDGQLDHLKYSFAATAK